MDNPQLETVLKQSFSALVMRGNPCALHLPTGQTRAQGDFLTALRHRWAMLEPVVLERTLGLPGGGLVRTIGAEGPSLNSSEEMPPQAGMSFLYLDECGANTVGDGFADPFRHRILMASPAAEPVGGHQLAREKINFLLQPRCPPRIMEPFGLVEFILQVSQPSMVGSSGLYIRREYSLRGFSDVQMLLGQLLGSHVRIAAGGERRCWPLVCESQEIEDMHILAGPL
jgi:hypothetical protein